MNYSGKSEILNATEKFAMIWPAGKIVFKGGNLDEQLFERYLYSCFSNPDLLIRTGGEIRISNFMLCKMAYTELVFVDEFWPDFSKESGEAIREGINIEIGDSEVKNYT